MARMVHCLKLNKEAEGLDLAPLPGPLGQKVYENISKEAWNEWIRLQTMMVNEYQLNLADPEARKHLLKQMQKHLFGDGVEAVPNYTPPK